MFLEVLNCKPRAYECAYNGQLLSILVAQQAAQGNRATPEIEGIGERCSSKYRYSDTYTPVRTLLTICEDSQSSLDLIC